MHIYVYTHTHTHTHTHAHIHTGDIHTFVCRSLHLFHLAVLSSHYGYVFLFFVKIKIVQGHLSRTRTLGEPLNWINWQRF
jgi:hypothetical protein